MDYAGFLEAVDAGRTPAVVLLHGPEPFLIDDAVARVTRRLFPDPGEAALSREVLEAREAGADGIVRSALTLPLLSAHRLVVARGVEALGVRQGEPLAAYCRAPNPSTVLLLVVDGELGAGHWLGKTLPPGSLVAAPALGGRALVRWLRDRAAAGGLEVTEEAAALIVQLSGEDLATLMGEVEKAALGGGPGNRRVTVDEVRAVVGEHRLRHVFELTRALERRELAAALAVLGALLRAGEEPLGVLGMIARDVRAAWLVREWLRQGRSAAEIGRGLRRPERAAAAVIALASGLSADGAARRLARCWEVERRLKSGGAAHPELSLLIADLCAA